MVRIVDGGVVSIPPRYRPAGPFGIIRAATSALTSMFVTCIYIPVAFGQEFRHTLHLQKRSLLFLGILPVLHARYLAIFGRPPPDMRIAVLGAN